VHALFARSRRQTPLIQVNAARRHPVNLRAVHPGNRHMHPILREILLEPVGWLAIGGSLVMFGIGLWVSLFLRKKMREEERRRGGR
jgi:hypothetical protein